ncbi:type IV toxin-antitoxin system AbiEi family antitoxin domain-containing protein [Tenggerimyces flavus]|uniref:Type IV toxin-antitoxin system AbiEi family antitoxin domain-containing protein n=1 Tax=Tenggerimyces flavus TaxID=1708749 RepID=A0ABV7Y6G1_9ACTN|nr:type IV toxin-antitoxin system AbiEi family antitoxin domain-containing protein [Tenggerimyces flavus]MBM7791119.1 hypothetical protein [Tenggerimyces flavus]
METQVLSRQQAFALGYSDKQIKARIRRGEWEHVRRGVYVDGPAWRAMDALGRHRVSIQAVRLTLNDDAVVSHISAAILHGWDSWRVPLDTVTVTREPPQHPRREAGVDHHVATLAADEVVEIRGMRVTSPERTMVDVARSYAFEQAVVLCDGALRSGAALGRALELYLRQSQWPGARHALPAIEFADGGSESVGESRLRVLCHRHGLPRPILQAPIYGLDGCVIARGDLLFEDERTLVEFDGKLKYGRGARFDVDPREVLFKEKRREDAIREEAGLEVVRVVWSDLDSPDHTAARLRAAFARAHARHHRAA